MGARLTKADYERIAWVKSSESGQKWFLKMRAKRGEKLGTQKYYALALKQFCEYLKTDPDTIVKTYEQELDQSVTKTVKAWNEKLDLFVPWLIDKYGLKRSVAVTRFNAVKSFFKYVTAIQLTATTPEFYSEEIRPVTIDDLREKILPVADLYQTFEILFLKDSGMSQDDALRLNVWDIEDLGNGFGYIKTHRAKEGVDYETFIGPNATSVMAKVLDFRRRLGVEVNDKSPLFVKKQKPTERQTANLIQGSLRRLGRKAGVDLSTHRLRKTFETFLALAKIHPIILKYWMGHKVKRGRGDIEGRYIIPPKNKQMEAYMEGYKYIDISPKADEMEMIIADAKARMAGMTPEEKKRFVEALAFRHRALADHPEIKELLEQGRADGKLPAEPKFKEVGENELLAHLQSGWQITHTLQNGKVIIERQ